MPIRIPASRVGAAAAFDPERAMAIMAIRALFGGFCLRTIGCRFFEIVWKERFVAERIEQCDQFGGTAMDVTDDVEVTHTSESCIRASRLAPSALGAIVNRA